jgi:hypothetical protein
MHSTASGGVSGAPASNISEKERSVLLIAEAERHVDERLACSELPWSLRNGPPGRQWHEKRRIQSNCEEALPIWLQRTPLSRQRALGSRVKGFGV